MIIFSTTPLLKGKSFPPMGKDFGSKEFTVAKLKAELSRRGLEIKGKKAELVARLKEAEASAESAAESSTKPSPEPASAPDAPVHVLPTQAPPATAAKPQAVPRKKEATKPVAMEAAAPAHNSTASAPKKEDAKPVATEAAATAPAHDSTASVPDEAAKQARADARRDKLRQLKARMNEGRKLNQTEMMDEEKGKRQAGSDNKRKHAEHVLRKAEYDKDRSEAGEDLTKPHMYESAEAHDVKKRLKKKKDKNKASFGWEVFNQDSLFNAFKKRSAAAGAGVDKEDYSTLKMNYGNAGGQLYPDANTMDYGHQSVAGRMTQVVPEANIARMVNELDDAAARRSKFSRRRAYNEEKDVDSISERNAVYNRKIARAFDKYTVEIRQNLERGTALPS